MYPASSRSSNTDSGSESSTESATSSGSSSSNSNSSQEEARQTHGKVKPGTGDQRNEQTLADNTDTSFCSIAASLNPFALSDANSSQGTQEDDEELLDEVLKNLNSDPVFANVVTASQAADEALVRAFTDSSGVYTSSSGIQANIASAPSNAFHLTACSPPGGSELALAHGTYGAPATAGVSGNSATSSMRVVFNATYEYGMRPGHSNALNPHQQHHHPQSASQSHHVQSPSLAAVAAASGAGTPLALHHGTFMPQPWDQDAAPPMDFMTPSLQLASAAALSHGAGHQLFSQDVKPTVHSSSAGLDTVVGSGLIAHDLSAGALQQYPPMARGMPSLVSGLSEQYRHGEQVGSTNSPLFSTGRLQVPKNVRLPQRRGAMQLWQFLLSLLDESGGDPALVKWTDHSQLEFCLLEPEEVAVRWGEIKHRPAMNYDKLSRSLRYYYDKGIMQKVSGERYVYKFTCPPELLYRALGERETGTKAGPRPHVRRSPGSGVPAASMPQFVRDSLHCAGGGGCGGMAIASVAAGGYDKHPMAGDPMLYAAAASPTMMSSPAQHGSADAKAMLHSFNHMPSYHFGHGGGGGGFATPPPHHLHYPPPGRK